jgi:hypothetical protein
MKRLLLIAAAVLGLAPRPLLVPLTLRARAGRRRPRQ